MSDEDSDLASGASGQGAAEGHFEAYDAEEDLFEEPHPCEGAEAPEARVEASEAPDELLEEVLVGLEAMKVALAVELGEGRIPVSEALTTCRMASLLLAEAGEVRWTPQLLRLLAMQEQVAFAQKRLRAAVVAPAEPPDA